jgi:hypothetical protein
LSPKIWIRGSTNRYAFHCRGKKLFRKDIPRFEEKILAGNVTLLDNTYRVYKAISAKIPRAEEIQ